MARPVTPTKKVCAMPDSFPSLLAGTTRSRAEQGRNEHGLSPRDARPGPGVDAGGAGEPAPLARREDGREADAEALALEVRLDDVARVREAPGVESGERDVVTDPGGFGRREEAALDQLPEQRQERLALGDQSV